MRVNVDSLKNCHLWYGSVLETLHKSGVLQVGDLQRRKNLYDKLDAAPLTNTEKEFYEAIEKTIQEAQTL